MTLNELVQSSQQRSSEDVMTQIIEFPGRRVFLQGIGDILKALEDKPAQILKLNGEPTHE